MLVSDEIIQDQQSQPEWIPLTEAAKRIGVSHGKLSRMAKQSRISSQKNPFDERETLVNMAELNRIFKRPE